MEERRVTRFHCPDSVTGHGSANLNGNCPYCGYKLEPKMRRLAPQIGATAELDDAYGYHWDPDFGKPD